MTRLINTSLKLVVMGICLLLAMKPAVMVILIEWLAVSYSEATEITVSTCPGCFLTTP